MCREAIKHYEAIPYEKEIDTFVLLKKQMSNREVADAIDLS
jgi:hypothetical protein